MVPGAARPLRHAVITVVVSGLLASCQLVTSRTEPHLTITGSGPRAARSESRGNRTFVHYVEGARVGIAMLLTNDSPEPVDITDVDGLPPDEPDLVFPIEATHAEMATEASPLDSVRMVRFHPFTLQPDASRWVAIMGRFDDCEHSGGGDWYFEDADVSWRYLGTEGTTTIPFARRITVAVTGESCPDAK